MAIDLEYRKVSSGGPPITATITAFPIRRRRSLPHALRLLLSPHRWIVSDRYNDTRANYIRRLRQIPELRWLNKYHFVPAHDPGISSNVIAPPTPSCGLSSA